jgi:uncharacterized protein (DUF697 family)
MELADGNPYLLAAVVRSRKLIHRRAIAAGVAGALPLPGLDWAVDAALLTRLLPRISAQFGLAASQIDQMDALEKERVRKAIALVGSVAVGRVVTQSMVLRLARVLGLRLTAAQASKYVPIAGQMVSSALGYTALRLLAEQHIRECVRVARHALPAPRQMN